MIFFGVFALYAILCLLAKDFSFGFSLGPIFLMLVFSVLLMILLVLGFALVMGVKFFAEGSKRTVGWTLWYFASAGYLIYCILLPFRILFWEDFTLLKEGPIAALIYIGVSILLLYDNNQFKPPRSLHRDD